MSSSQGAAQRQGNGGGSEGTVDPESTQTSSSYQAVRNADFILSCIRIKLLNNTLDAALLPYPGDDAFKKMRAEMNDVFVHRRRGEGIALVPLTPGANVDNLCTLPANEHLGIIRALISHRLPALLPNLGLRRRQFEHERILHTFDILEKAFEQAKIKRPRACVGLHKFPRTGLTIQLIKMPSRETTLGMTIRLRQRYEIEPNAKDLLDRRFDLRGCWLYDPAPDAHEKWIGRVTGIAGRYVVVEGDQGVRHVDPERYRIEARQETLRNLLGQFLRPSELNDVERAEQQLMASVFSGDGYLRKLCRMSKEFRNRGVLEAAPSMRFQFTGLLDAESRVHVQRLPPTRYCFRPDRSAIHTIPSSGLEQYGPFQRCNDTPRILVVHPQEFKDEIKMFVERLLHGGYGSGRGPMRRGFLHTFGFTGAELQWAPVVYSQGASAEAVCYRRAIQDAWNQSNRPEIALVFLRDHTDETVLGGPYIISKAHLLLNGVPSQEVRMDTVRSHQAGLPYILENIAIAMHAKLGGTPWTVLSNDSSAREIVLGMAHAEIGPRFSARNRYMGITTVFSSDGSYWLAASSGRCAYEEYPVALSRSVTEILARLKHDQAWRRGDRVRLIVHTRKPLKNTDISSVIHAATRELSTDICFETACLTVHRDHPWKVVEPRQNGRNRNSATNSSANTPTRGERVPSRGTVVHLGARQRLLCVKDGTLMLRDTDPMPQPLRLELHKHSTYENMNALTRQVLDFAGLSWRSSRCIFEPVTTYYAHLIADHINHLSTVEGWSDAVIDTQLAGSLWFL
ncbi:Piwi domain-containing protein [Sorangium sp. So ce834]|uniref:Piwi domain-containing protein n=1 Tax=Sorangium sp. So ce834 TaxID=3133321 RepID=UPI003F5E57D4